MPTSVVYQRGNSVTMMALVLVLGLSVCCIPTPNNDWNRDRAATEEGRHKLIETYHEQVKSRSKSYFRILAAACDAMCYYCHSDYWKGLRSERFEEMNNVIETDALGKQVVSLKTCRNSCVISREMILRSYNFRQRCLKCVKNEKYC